MAIFAVQRELPGITMEQLAGAQKAAISTSEQFSKDGIPVKYVRSNFYPGSNHCTCLFEAADADAVKQVNDAAALPYMNIEEVLDLNP